MIDQSLTEQAVANLLEHVAITGRQSTDAADVIVGRHPTLGAVVLVLDGFTGGGTLLSEVPLQEPEDATSEEIAAFQRIAIELGIVPAAR